MNNDQQSTLNNHQIGVASASSITENSSSMIVDGSNDENSALAQETTRNNALLKQLLRNCPSADLNKTVSETTTLDSPKSPIVDKEMKTEMIMVENKPSSCMEDENNLTNITETVQTSNDHIICNDSTSCDSVINDQIMANSNASSQAEKKLTYLDIRRAQLERDPTPPPEEIKPKRKRNIKRKESKSVDESIENNGSNQGGANSTTAPKTTKKRSRKGSQNRVEDAVNSNEHHESMIKTILNHLRTFPSVPIMEPNIRPNLNVCLPSDASDLNSSESKLRGTYGNSFLSSTIDYYSTYPFGPNKTSSVVPTIPPVAQGNNSHKCAYYLEEFSYVKNVVDINEHLKEQRSKEFSLYFRESDSPETVVSSSSPECVQYDMPMDQYNKMKYINDESDLPNFDDDRESPLLYMPLPVKASATYSNLNENLENDKENVHSNQIVKVAKLNSTGGPFKDSGNVNITLMLSAEHDVRSIIFSLAKILKVTSTITYNVEKSPLDCVTEVLEFEGNKKEYCKHCDELLKHNLDTEFDGNYFCNQECLIAYKSKMTHYQPTVDPTVNKEVLDKSLIDNEGDENEIINIFSEDRVTKENDQPQMNELEFKFNIEEKRWKNTRYLYWDGSSFKKDTQPSEAVEENGETIEQSFDKLGICLKPKGIAIEKRVCIFCHMVGDGEINGASRLLNMDIDKWVHLNCALWSMEVYEMLNGALISVDQAYKRSMNLTCASSVCGKVGASLKCFKPRCNNSYHFPCAIKEKCVFFKDKTIFCSQHSPKSTHPTGEELKSFVVERRVFINRDEQKQIAAMIHQGDHNLMRIGSLIFLNIGQLLPHQLQNFHTNSYIYPIGYKISRFYWSFRRLGKRCQYICSINEVDGKPRFSIEIREEGFENVTYHDSTPKRVWQHIIEPIAKMREESETIKVFTDFITGEDLFGLNEPAIIRILESLPGVDTLYDYNSKYGRSPLYELPLAINPTGCARTEPKMRTHFKRPHTLHVSTNNISRSSLQSSLATIETNSLYVKQFVHSKVSQYRKMKMEWRNNVYLARSGIQGLGLYAVRDIEKNTMIIEYIGLLIRNEMAERNERVHEAHVSFDTHSINHSFFI